MTSTTVNPLYYEVERFCAGGSGTVIANRSQFTCNAWLAPIGTAAANNAWPNHSNWGRIWVGHFSHIQSGFENLPLEILYRRKSGVNLAQDPRMWPDKTAQPAVDPVLGGQTVPIEDLLPYPMPQPNPNFPAPWPFPEFWPDMDPSPDPTPSTGQWPYPNVPPLVQIDFTPDRVPRPSPRPRPVRPPVPNPAPSPSPQPEPSPSPLPTEPPVLEPAPNVPPVPAPLPVPPRYGGPVPNPSKPEKGTKEKKFRGTWVAAHMIDILSEAAEVVDCVYDALPSIAEKAAKRKDFSDRMQDFWKEYKKAAPKTAQDKAKLLAKKPKWNKDWADPNKAALDANKAFDKPLPAQYELDGAHVKLGYIYDHFNELDAAAMSEALKCAAMNHYMDKVLGKTLPAGSNVRRGLGKMTKGKRPRL